MLRSDFFYTEVGENVVIGDRVMLHNSGYPKDDIPTIVGNNVIVGAGAILHACKVEDGAVIGMGAQVLDNAIVGSKAKLAPGSILPVGKKIPPRELWSGVPARFQRHLSPTELQEMEEELKQLQELAIVHAQEQAKDWIQIDEEDAEAADLKQRGVNYWPKLTKEEMSKRAGEIDWHDVPGRILNHPCKPTTVL